MNRKNVRGKSPSVRGKAQAAPTNPRAPFTGRTTLLGALSAMNGLIDEYKSMEGPSQNETRNEILTSVSRAISTNDTMTIEQYCRYHKSLMPSLINTSNTNSILHNACKHSRVMAVQIFMECQGNPNLLNKSQRTPLHKAYGSVDIARILIQYGAKVDLRDNKGFTPLHRAIIKKNYAVAKYLVKVGSDPRVLDLTGRSPIDYCDDLKIIEELKAIYSWNKAKLPVFVYKFSDISRIPQPIFKDFLAYL